MREITTGVNIALLSIHGLIRGHNLELGRDADTGGQTLYVVELAQILSRQAEVARVDLITRRIVDKSVSSDYAEAIEILSDKLRIVRIGDGADEYLAKEQLWDHLDVFADNLAVFFRDSGVMPDIIHSHYADAGYVGAHLANLLGIPQIHTGHSLGRVKRSRLLASGLSAAAIEKRYHMSRRIEAEEIALATAERVITSTHQEIDEQYGLYDFYQPEQMCVIPPGTNLNQFRPPTGNELDSTLYTQLTEHFKQADKPIILALSRPDRRKNIAVLIEAYGSCRELQELANLLIIAGNRDDIEDLEQGAQEVFIELLLAMDRYDLYGKVALPKHHQRDQVAMIYRITAASGGVFVNPALTEPFGLTLIEAAASGLPIVATEDGGPRDIIENCQNGILIDPLEPASISDAVNKLMRNRKLYQDYVQNGLQGVREFYSWEAHARRYLELILPIVQECEPTQHRPLQRRSEIYQQRAIASDLDLNLIGEEHSPHRLMELLRAHRKTTLFIIATGRRLDMALKLLKRHNMPEPDVLITSSGTEIHYAPKLATDTAWARHIDYHWSPHKLRQLLDDYPGLQRQPRIEQSRFKLSYYIDTERANIDEIKRLLHQEEQSVHVQLAFGQYLDILPQRASKGMALRYVAERWNIPLDHVFVAGGSGADEDMMRGNTLAAVVANRHNEELHQLADIERIYFANRPYEDGIIEALEYYDFFGRCQDPKEVGVE